MTQLDGPSLPPASGGKADSLVIFLHGYGDSGVGLIGIGHEWSQELPNTAFVSPNAVEVCDAFSSGYQWFPIRTAEGISTKAFDRSEVVQKPAAALNDFIDAQLEKWGVSEDSLIVAGFSQGAMMAMYSMPRRKNPCAGVIGYSGLLVDTNGLKDDSISKMPILAIHGAVDDVVPPECLDGVSAGFSDAGFNIETILRPNLGHSIDQFSLIRGVNFIQECLENKEK